MDLAALRRPYDPAAEETPVYALWERSQVFLPRQDAERRFSMVMPPPNVTAQLHIGHALDNAMPDVLARWRRMMGDAVLWVPGTDHAGIATHAVVERRLQAEGVERRAIGRDAFVQAVWQWKDEYEARITGQLKRLGCSCDWSSQRFTMDPGLSAAVEEVFVRYHDEGLIYQGDYLVNWCPRCGTAISDLEVEHEEEDRFLYHLRYPLEGGGEIVVATVRPETMLGDTAVAVHPDDDRYRDAVGRRAILPLVGRHIPIVADAHVDLAFGTGALKVTPAHSAADAEIAGRHGLDAVAVIGADGAMTAEAGAFAGMTVAQARDAVVQALRASGALVAERPYRVPVARCSRCGEAIEPLVSRQWFVRVRPLCDAAAAAVRRGDVVFQPESFTKIFLQWMDDAHDWCISRQIWWGHRIPAYTCARCGKVVVARSPGPSACPACGGEVRRDPDVLDTWFSSALWPFSVFGWPEATPAFQRFYPTDVLVTGRDIIFLWVARMLFSGLHFTGRAPFSTVVLHGLVRDAEGRKMSKSLGNGVDPLEVIDRYGADVLRMALLAGTAPGNDSRFQPERLEGGQRFCNKLWNAARFVVDATGGAGAANAEPELEDRHIRSRLSAVAGEVERALRRHDPGPALQALHSFIWDEFCDWYLEACKSRLHGRHGEGSRAAAQISLRDVFAGILRLLHPFAPFITEAVWQRLPDRSAPVLAVASWPDPAEWPADPLAEAEFGLAREIVGTVRALAAEMGVPAGARLRLLLRGAAPPTPAQARLFAELGRVDDVELRPLHPGEVAASAVVGAGVELHLPLAGLVDVAAQVRRLQRDLEGAERQLGVADGRLADPGFTQRARPEVVAREQQRREELSAKVRRLGERIGALGGG